MLFENPEISGQVVFLHGLESGPNGTKSNVLKKNFGSESPDFTGMDFPSRMKKMDEVYSDRNDLILVGSSMGGVVAIHWANKHPEKVRALVLIAPAVITVPSMEQTVRKAKIPTCHPEPVEPCIVLIGKHDDVVPATELNFLFMKSKRIVLPDGHRMSSPDTLKTIVDVVWGFAK